MWPQKLRLGWLCEVIDGSLRDWLRQSWAVQTQDLSVEVEDINRSYAVDNLGGIVAASNYNIVIYNPFNLSLPNATALLA